MEYTADNLDALVLARRTAKGIGNSGGRLKGPWKRITEQDIAFERAVDELLKANLGSSPEMLLGSGYLLSA